MKANSKVEKILDVALELLRTAGDYGLTMRKVAVNANMSLSNVQYYFKNKDLLLKAMADRYFVSCLDELKEMKPIRVSEDNAQELQDFLVVLLSHGMEMSEMCRVFREYWALSTRNTAIEAHVKLYYQELVEVISELLKPAAKSEQGLSEAVSLLIPYVEGYSITALSMPLDLEATVDLISASMLRLLGHQSRS